MGLQRTAPVVAVVHNVERRTHLQRLLLLGWTNTHTHRTSREATEHPESRPPPAHSPRLEHPFLGQEPRSQARGSFLSPQSAMPKARSERRNRVHVWGGDGEVTHLVVERDRVAPRFGHVYLTRDRCRTVAAVAASTWARELGTNARDVKKVRVLGVGFVSAALSGGRTRCTAWTRALQWTLS